MWKVESLQRGGRSDANPVVVFVGFFKNIPFGVGYKEKRLIFVTDAIRESVRKAYLRDAPGWSFWSIIH